MDHPYGNVMVEKVVIVSESSEMTVLFLNWPRFSLMSPLVASHELLASCDAIAIRQDLAWQRDDGGLGS